MDSPEATSKPSSSESPPVKDSPFFDYVSNLSPIQLVNVRPAAYGDINFPSPEPVFTSPHINQPRKLDLLRRSEHLPLPSSEKLSHCYAIDATSLAGNVLVTGPPCPDPVSQTITCTQKDCRSDLVQDKSSPSTSVDMFLVDPLENGDNPSNSPDVYLKQIVEMSQDKHGNGVKKNEVKIDCKEDISQRDPINPLVSVDDSLRVSGANLSDSHANQFCSILPDLHSDSISINDTNKEPFSNTEQCIINQASENLNSSYQSERHPEKLSFIVSQAEKEKTLKITEDWKETSERSHSEELQPVSRNASISGDSSVVPDTATLHVLNSMDQKENQYFGSKDEELNDLSCVKVNPTSDIHGHEAQDAKLHAAEGVQLGELNCTPQFLPESVENLQVVDGHVDCSAAISLVSAANQTPWDPEDATAQYQRGMRKRLQFDAVENHRLATWCNSDSGNSSNEVSRTESEQVPPDMHAAIASNEISSTDNSKLLVRSISGNELRKPLLKVDKNGRRRVISPRKAPKPSGIGLHLNSVGGIGQINCKLNMPSSGPDLGLQQEKPVLGSNESLSLHLSDSIPSPALIGHSSLPLSTSSERSSPYPASDNSIEEHQDNQVSKQPNSSADYQSLLDAKSLHSSLQSQLNDRYMTPCNVKRLLSEDTARSEESSQTSPRKKRKKASEDEGHKRCNCKRSKCLKLYCDCFAAGQFCSEACACQDCSNRTEYEDAVREARQQIESRNPLAFAPKVVLRSQPNQDNDENKGVTPTSARHKRGCNCKKSLCLKKYCECYQAGVGCSFGCRCEGCKNTFGRKDGCGELIEIEHKSLERDQEKHPCEGKLERTGINREMISIAKHHPRLSPLTPSIEGSNGNNVPKSQKLPASYYTSPESGALHSSYYEESPSSPMNSMSNSAFGKAGEELSAVSYNQDNSSLTLASFSPGWDGFPDICNLSPLPNPSPGASDACAPSKTRDHKIIQTKLLQGSARLSAGSLCWRSSPATPLCQFGDRKILLEPDSDSALPNILEDDTPEILDDTCLPIKAVKANSPKQKRVSPPQRRLYETRSSSSPSLRSGRKFILQSVPSFPPLTPYSNNNRGKGSS
ncbi:uncharacterized protein [Typha latifolia]|uniref:uncharacterized protein n=1 Tax=Typha latifolia TaxID=4733 RepID=UPI003C2FD8FE